MTWRVGNKLRRTLYRDEVLVGMVDTPEIAQRICDGLNLLEESATGHVPYGEWCERVQAWCREGDT